MTIQSFGSSQSIEPLAKGDIQLVLSTLNNKPWKVKAAGIRGLVGLPLTDEARNEIEVCVVDGLMKVILPKLDTSEPEHEGTIRQVLETSVQLPSQKIRREVRKALNSDRIVVRRAAARALSMAQDPAARCQLIDDLKREKDDRVRVQAAEQLANIDVTPIQGEVKSLFQNEKRDEARFWMATALAAAGDSEPLESYLQEVRQKKVTFEYFPQNSIDLAEHLRGPVTVSNAISRWIGANEESDSGVEQVDVILAGFRDATNTESSRKVTPTSQGVILNEFLIATANQNITNVDGTNVFEAVSAPRPQQEILDNYVNESPFNVDGQLPNTDFQLLMNFGVEQRAKLITTLFRHIINHVPQGGCDQAGKITMALVQCYGPQFNPDVPGLVTCYQSLKPGQESIRRQIARTLGRAAPRDLIYSLHETLAADDAVESGRAAELLRDVGKFHEESGTISAAVDEISQGLESIPGASLTTDELESEPQKASGHVNLKFTDITKPRSHRELELHEGFRAGFEYKLKVTIDNTADPRASQNPPPISVDEFGEVELRVTLFIEGNEISLVDEPTRTLKWDVGNQTTQPAEFLLKASTKTGGQPADLDVYIFYRDNLLYTAALTIEVQSINHEWDEQGRPIVWKHTDDPTRTALYQTIRDLNTRRSRPLSLAIQAGSMADSYKLTAFIGTAEYSARARFTREQLISHLAKMRRAMDILRRQLLYVRGGYDTHGVYAGVYRNGAGNLNANREKLADTDTEAEFRKFLTEMAVMGWQFYDDLFQGEAGAILRNTIETHTKPDDVIQIWIDDEASDFIYPWTWIYTIEVQPGRRVSLDASKFWGYRYIIELLPQFPETRRRSPPPELFRKNDGIDLKMGSYDLNPITGNQREFFEKQFHADHSLRFEIWKDSSAWENFLPECESQILYFLSHGHTAKPLTLDAQAHGDMLDSWRSWLNSESPDEPQAMKEFRQQGKKFLEELRSQPGFPDESFIKLTIGLLTLRQLRGYDLTQSAPLVFLNICESAQVYPHMSDGFIDTLLKAGARGVLGTEMPMVPTFADLFARRLFKLLFNRKAAKGSGPVSVGESLLLLRREFLDEQNPLGFAYTYFGNVDARLDESLLEPPA